MCQPNANRSAAFASEAALRNCYIQCNTVGYYKLRKLLPVTMEAKHAQIISINMQWMHVTQVRAKSVGMGTAGASRAPLIQHMSSSFTSSRSALKQSGSSMCVRHLKRAFITLSSPFTQQTISLTPAIRRQCATKWNELGSICSHRVKVVIQLIVVTQFDSISFQSATEYYQYSLRV